MCYYTAAGHHKGSHGSQVDGTGRGEGELCRRNDHHPSKLGDLCPSHWVYILTREFVGIEGEKGTVHKLEQNKSECNQSQCGAMSL